MPSAKKKAADFLSALSTSGEEPPQPARQKTPRALSQDAPKPAAGGKRGKHIGGYFDDTDFLERVAVLRARLGLDNSALIRQAIDDLHRKHIAARSFGDA